jgi:hypothetical protein
VKPDWVAHYDDKKNRRCIFSIDFHPNGQRFATGGLGKLQRYLERRT